MRNRGRAGPCLEISCETFFQPRIPAHLIWCILHTACTLFLGTHLKYNPPPYLRKLTLSFCAGNCYRDILAINRGTWCGRLFWYISAVQFPGLDSCSIISRKSAPCGQIPCIHTTLPPTIHSCTFRPEHGTRFWSGGFAGKAAYTKSDSKRPRPDRVG